jgi:hypothetical protein
VTDNGAPVSFGRWYEAHTALADRVTRLERAAELASQRHEAGSEARANRVWVLVLGITTGVVAPLVTGAIITWLHLRTH